MRIGISAKQEMENQLWLIANSKEAEFELFCKTNDLDQNEPTSLKIFINEENSKTISRKEDNAESFYANGFFICWADMHGKYRIFTKSKHEANTLSALFYMDDKIIWTEKYEVRNGIMSQVA